MAEMIQGERKLTDAARALGVDMRGKVVLDIGSSTGGFTKVALGLGAAKVVAVEKGTGQMRGDIRGDARVELYEKTDIFGFEMTSKPDVIVADVSFVSLTKVLEYAKMKLIGPQTVLLVMLKPQFEAKAGQLVKGVVKNERMRREIIRDFEVWLKRAGFVVVGKRDNEVMGRHGNRERFYRLITSTIM